LIGNRSNASVLSELELPLPPLPEQRRIVAKLDALDARAKRARADLDRIPALVARAKQAILAKAFRGELTAEWRDAPAENTSQKHAAIRVLRQANPRLSRRQILAKTPDFSIPGNWAWISPDEVAADEKYSIGIGPFGSNLVKSDYREAGVRLVFVRDIRRESFSADDARYVEHKKASELYQHLARPGDVLITKMGDPPGDCCVFPLDAEPAIITADCIKLTPHVDLAESKYLNYCIRSEQVQSQFKGITAGVAQQKVSLERFRQLALPIAPLAEQSEIVRRIESAFQKIDRIAADAASASKLLGRLDQAILTKAFRGELVPQNPEDESASILLDRFRATTKTAPRKGRGRKA
jgi:type I restriction enzyme S subunit